MIHSSSDCSGCYHSLAARHCLTASKAMKVIRQMNCQDRIELAVMNVPPHRRA